QSSIQKAYQIARFDRKLKKRIVRLPSNQHPVKAYANEDAVIQIIMNLLFNAADSTAEEGFIAIDLQEGRSNVVELRVIDNGSGIPCEIQHRIFDPFFSGKESREGTGLGLSVSYSLARSFQGELSLELSDANGTTFLLKVPIPEEHHHDG
ncbi:MAG: ATP-binding protein, partial [bacterium]